MKKRILTAALVWFFCSQTIAAPAHYSDHPEALKWLQEMKAAGFEEAYLKGLLANARRQESILEAISRPAEKRLEWGEYRQRFLTSQRIKRGVIFWFEHAEALARAEKENGVPAEMIVAIIGVETFYGRNMGSYRALDALATLGFDYPPRSEFFRRQLGDLLTLAKAENRPVESFKGSYAGAMGYGQFIPSSFLAFAKDFDGDGDRDIWGNPTDAIGSVANYFKQHGWITGGEVVLPVALPESMNEQWVNTGKKPEDSLKLWQTRGLVFDADDLKRSASLLMLKTAGQPDYYLGLENFYVITRYNRSRLYAMAVYELSRAIKGEWEQEMQENTQ